MFLCLLRYFCVEVIVFYILLGSLRCIVTMFSFEINIHMYQPSIFSLETKCCLKMIYNPQENAAMLIGENAGSGNW